MSFNLGLLVILVLVVLSALFSMSETAMTAARRHRVSALAQQGNRNAQKMLWLMDHLDQLLAVILISNTLVNAMLTTLITAMAIDAFGNDDWVISVTTGCVAFLLIVFAEITPKYLGALFPERIAVPASGFLRYYTTLALPATWFVNLFVRGLLRLMRIRITEQSETARISSDELRALLQTGSTTAHHKLLLNTLDLESLRISALMKSRSHIEALDLSEDMTSLRQHISTAHHNSLLVYENDMRSVIGILHVRKAIHILIDPDAQVADLRAIISPGYFVLQNTPVLVQLHAFQEAQERLGLVIDEYGTVRGLITIDDILEEVVGQFTTSFTDAGTYDLKWDHDGECVLDANISVRKVNKRLGLNLPTRLGNTLNGLVSHYLQDLPDSPVSLKINGFIIEVVQVQPQGIKTVRLFKPASKNKLLST